jgi:hypothetical protein
MIASAQAAENTRLPRAAMPLESFHFAEASKILYRLAPAWIRA